MGRILYVTEFWVAFRDMLYFDGDIIKGMPGFIKPLKGLRNRGDDVDLILLTSVPEDYVLLQSSKPFKTNLVSRENILDCIYYQDEARFKKMMSLWSLTQRVKKCVEKQLHRTKYDFVYAQGPNAYGAISIANQYRIPCGQRLYGIAPLWNMYERGGLIRAFLHNPLAVLSFLQKKKFLLVTDDGSKGDAVYMAIAGRKKRYKFCFWTNGVDTVAFDAREEARVLHRYAIKNPAIFYCARIASIKRQDRAVNVIALLKKLGSRAEVYFAGQKSETAMGYWNEVEELAQESGVRDQVHFLGALNQVEMAVLAKKCDVSLLLGDFSNLGNVFHELLRNGAVIVAADDGSLENYIENGVNGFLVKSDEEAASRIEKLIRQDTTTIRNAARETSRKKMLSWKTRVEKELDLIDDAVHPA